MKKHIFIFIFLSIIFPAASFSQEMSCTQIMQKFRFSSGEINSGMRDKIVQCESLCKNLPNYKSIPDFCGVDDCKLEFVNTGIVSDWCARLAEYWRSKQGVQENPLKRLEQPAQRKDFLYCIESYNATGIVPEECCNNQLPTILKFNESTGNKILKHCSRKISAQQCLQNYTYNRKISPACCAFYKVASKKFSETPEFLEEYEVTEVLDASEAYCDRISFNKNYLVKSCLDEFNSKKTINKDCCKAFEKGVLVPDYYGIDYIKFERICR